MRALLLLILVACETGEPPSGDAVLVAAYAMDDLGGGSTAADRSGNGIDGACTTCPTIEPGKRGNAFRFDGGDQQIDIAPHPRLTARFGVSVATWIKLDAMPAIPGCAAVRGAAWQLCIGTDLAPRFGSLAGTGMVTLGAWHHVAIAWDRDTKRIYLDGAEVLALAGPVPDDPGGIALGAELVGALDELHVYDGALSARQLAELVQ